MHGTSEKKSFKTVKNLAFSPPNHYPFAMIPEHLARQFSHLESDFPFIIPALRNGLIVTVTLKIAQEFKLSAARIVVGGIVKEIKFKKTELNLWEMSLEK
jgi:hypothetical protein